MGYLFNYYEQIIEITFPQDVVLIQDLLNAIRAAEFHNTGMAYPKIADASGKETLGGNVSTGITVFLYPNWQLRFWAGNYTAQITGGNLVGGINGNPIAYVAGVQVIMVQSASSTIVASGSGLSPEEHTKLMSGLDISIPFNVWEEMMNLHQTGGTAGRTLSDAKRRATMAALKSRG